MWPTGIQTFSPNPVGRDLVVGDIHGCFAKLEHSLASIGFDPARDRLFSAGDLVDRGPESAQVTEWLDRPWFHAVCGNHDFMAWRRTCGQPYPDVDHREHGGGWLDAVPDADKRSIGDRLAALPLALEIASPGGGLVGVVHADCPFDDWNELRVALRAPAQPPARASNLADACLWSIERYARQYAGVVAGVRAVVHGHLTLAEPVRLGNAHFIDTGGGDPSGHFTFFDAQSLQCLRGPGGTYRRLSRRSMR
jgi:serine/threonine protein phosphatase 1